MTLSKGLFLRFNIWKELSFKHKPRFAPLRCGMEDRGCIKCSEMRSFFPLQGVLGISCPHPADVIGLCSLCGQQISVKAFGLTSLVSSLPTFLGAPWEVPSQKYFSLSSFFHIFIFLEKVERLQSASHASWFLVVCSCSSMHTQWKLGNFQISKWFHC